MLRKSVSSGLDKSGIELAVSEPKLFLVSVASGVLQMVVALLTNRSGKIGCLQPVSLPPPQKREGVE